MKFTQLGIKNNPLKWWQKEIENISFAAYAAKQIFGCLFVNRKQNRLADKFLRKQIKKTKTNKQTNKNK